MRALRPPLILLCCVAATALQATERTESAARSYYREAGTYATLRESEPPAYVRHFLPGEGITVPGLSAVLAGADYRSRYEYRRNDLRRLSDRSVDTPLLSRTRGFLGFSTAQFPLHIVTEFEDAQFSSSDFAATVRDENRNEWIQYHASLRFNNVLPRDPRGQVRPLSLQGGRMAFELLDRRLMARNEWRNTTNNFEGLRFSAGDQHNDWQLEGFSLRPVQRSVEERDRVDSERQLYGLIGHWRRWSRYLTLEPHYLQLDQRTDGEHRQIHSLGLRTYGVLANPAFNYDFNLTEQWGQVGERSHRARGFTGEIGHTWMDLDWQPRLSLFYGHATGGSPDARRHQRFERFFGFARPWSSDDYIVFENIQALRNRLEFRLSSQVVVDTGLSAFWLASRQDHFANLLAGSAFNSDPSGQSGRFLGHSADLRLRASVGQRTRLNLGYSHFTKGTFTQNRQQAALGSAGANSNFFYLEVSLSVF